MTHIHGELKVAGGKLVVIDADRRDGALHDVVLSGDFFLEPDDALGWLTESLQGVPDDVELTALTERLTAARRDAVMLGFEPRDIALTVLRALGRASGWSDHDFELVETEPLDPPLQMAVDEVLIRQVASGRRTPALRWWDWASAGVIIGSYQSVRNEVDLEAADELDVTVVRRISGGGAMFVEPGNTITYSLYVPDTLVAGQSFASSYAFLDDWVLRGLRRVGVEATYAGLNDIASPAGKIGGAAQKRVPGGVLHHVTMSYDIDTDKMLRVLRIGREKLSDKGTTSAKKRVDPLRRQTGLDHDAVVDRLIAYFRGRYGLTDDKITPEEQSKADRLIREKFTDPEWTNRVP